MCFCVPVVVTTSPTVAESQGEKEVLEADGEKGVTALLEESGVKVTLHRSQSNRLWKVSAILLLGVVEFLCGAALSILAPFYTSEAAKHGLSVTESSVVFASVFILQIFLTPIFGKFIVRLGSINLLLWGAVVAGLANVCFGFLGSIESGDLFFGISLLLRAFIAIGESAINTSVYPLARTMSPEGYASTSLSLMETLYGLGTTMGPFIGGLLYELGGFYLPFLVCGSLMVIMGLLASLTILLKVTKSEELEQVSEHNVQFRIVLQYPGVIVGCLVVVLTGMSTQWYQPTMEPYLSSQFGLSSFTASMFLVIDGAVYALVTPVFGILLDRGFNAKLCLAVGSAVVALSFLLLGPVALPIEPSPLQVGGAMAVHGIGMAANFIGSLTLLSQEVERERLVGGSMEQAQGIATSLWITCECIGSFLGSFSGGYSFDSIGWNKSCLLVSLLQLSGLLVLTMLSLYTMLPWFERTKYRSEAPHSTEKRRLLTKEVLVVDYGSNTVIAVATPATALPFHTVNTVKPVPSTVMV